MIIERTNNEIILRLPKNISLDALQDLIDIIEYEEISKKSKASQKDVDTLVKSIKKERWAKTQQLLDR